MLSFRLFWGGGGGVSLNYVTETDIPYMVITAVAECADAPPTCR